MTNTFHNAVGIDCLEEIARKGGQATPQGKQRFDRGPVLAYVPAEAFTPPPKVNSAFVSMEFRSAPPAPVRNEALLWRMVKANFNQRRKTLLNALKGVEGVAPEALRAALEAQGHSPSLRGEALGVEEWIALSNTLADFA